MISMFSSTYQCEELFSLTSSNKSPVRFRLSDTHLNSVLKVASSNKNSLEIEKLVTGMSNIANIKMELY